MVKSIPTALAFDERHDNAAFKTPVNFQTDPDPVTLSPKLWNWYFESQKPHAFGTWLSQHCYPYCYD